MKTGNGNEGGRFIADRPPKSLSLNFRGRGNVLSALSEKGSVYIRPLTSFFFTKHRTVWQKKMVRN